MKKPGRYSMMVDLCVRLKEYELDCEAQKEDPFDIYDKKSQVYFVFNSDEKKERIVRAETAKNSSGEKFGVLNVSVEGMVKTANGFVFTDIAVTMIAFMIRMNLIDRKYGQEKDTGYTVNLT